MAISTAQYIDLLFKKLQGVAKTATATQKSASNESIASPPLLRGDIVWVQSDQIPGTAAVVSGITQGYLTTSRIECTPDPTVPTIGGISPTWLTNLTDWIPQEFGPTWPVKVWVDNTGATDPTVTGTQIFAPGIGGVGEFYFDPMAGLLNFIGETIPATLTSGKSIFITGYRYVGLLGVTNLPSGTTIGNIEITGNTIASLNTNGDIVLDPNGTGNVVVLSGNLNVSAGNVSANYFVGNGSLLTGIVASSGTGISNGTSNVNIATANGNVTVSVDGTPNVAVFGSSGLEITGNVSASGNITGNYIIGNGSGLTATMVDRGGDPNNWNTLFEMGTYTVNRLNWGGVTGPPLQSQVYIGLLTVSSSNSVPGVSAVQQVFAPGSQVNMDNIKVQYVRNYWTGTWSPWVKMVNDVQQIDGGTF